MLDQEILQQLKGIFAKIKSRITFSMQSKGESEASAEMVSFLDDVASTSDKFDVHRAEADVEAPTFEIVRDGTPTGVRFCGIPNGHEFTTLLLAVLNADGQGKNLPDEALCARIKALKGPVKLRTFVSLTCTNCPDVAQALNVIALLNPGVENTVTDGAVVPALVEELNIQSVPTVYADGTCLSVGRSSLGDLLEKLETLYGADENAQVSPVTREYDVVVMGGGPAGASAAIYCARKGFNTAVVAKAIGGQVRETLGIENMISVPKTTGSKLAANLKEHLGEYAIDVFENRTVDSAKVDGQAKVLSCGNETFRSKALIIATGAGWRRLSVAGEAEHIGHGVSGIKVKDRVSGAETVYPVSGVFVQVGLVPNSSLFAGMLPMTKGGEIIVDERCRTSVTGVYAAGDVTNVPYKQIIVAMGEGAKAALSVFEDAMRSVL